MKAAIAAVKWSRPVDGIRKRLKTLIDETRAQRQTAQPPLVEVHPLVSTLARPMVPLWACAMLVALIGCLIYSGLNWRLGNAAEPLLRTIYQTPLPQITAGRRPSSRRRCSICVSA